MWRSIPSVLDSKFARSTEALRRDPHPARLRSPPSPAVREKAFFLPPRPPKGRVIAYGAIVADFLLPSFPRKRESIPPPRLRQPWIPAFAGMTTGKSTICDGPAPKGGEGGSEGGCVGSRDRRNFRIGTLKRCPLGFGRGDGDAAADRARSHIAPEHRVIFRQGPAVGHGEPEPQQAARLAGARVVREGVARVI